MKEGFNEKLKQKEDDLDEVTKMKNNDSHKTNNNTEENQDK